MGDTGSTKILSASRVLMPEARIADLANDRVFAGEHFDLLLFAQAHFAQAIGQIVVTRQVA